MNLPRSFYFQVFYPTFSFYLTWSPIILIDFPFVLDGNESVAVESSVCKFSNYGISNKESVAELFLSLLNKVGFCILR